MFEYVEELSTPELEALRTLNQDLIARVKALQQDLQTAAQDAGLDAEAATEFTGWLSLTHDYGMRLNYLLTHPQKGR